MTLFRSLVLGSVVVLLAACGGGGGSGGGPSGNFSISTNTVTFDGDPSGATPAPAIVNGSVTGVGSTVYLFVLLTNTGIVNATVQLTGDTTGALTIFPRSPAQLGFGTYTDTVTVRACLDPNCAQQIAGSPRTITVTYNVRGLQVAPPDVTLTSTEGVAPAAAQASLTNNTTATWTSSITYQAGASGWLTMTPTTAATQGAQPLTFNATALTPGNYAATVRVTAGTRTVDIPVAYTVSPNLKASPSTVTLTAVTGQIAPAIGANVAISAASGAGTFTPSISYGGGASGWLAATGNAVPGTLTLVPQTVALAPGSYGATVTLTPAGPGTPITVPVTYTLAPSALTLSPATPTFSIDAASTNAGAFTQRTVVTGDTGAPLTWAASENSPWLQVTPNGSSGQDAIVSLVPAALQPLTNCTHQATVTFTYDGPSVVNQTRQLTVDLSLKLPTVQFAAPHVAYLSEQKPLVLRGSDFNQPGGGAVLFDGTPAASAQLVSDTEIRVVPPVIGTASRPVVSIGNDLDLDRSDAELVVRAKPSYGNRQFAFAAGIPTGFRILYDAERDLVFGLRAGVAFDPPVATLDSVLRFALDPNGVAPATFSFLGFQGIQDIGLSPNGTTLYVLTNTHLHFRDPADLSQQTRPPVAAAGGGRMAVTNDGRILLPHQQRFYSPLTDQFELAGTPTSDGLLEVSADGSRVALQSLTGSGMVRLGTYEAGSAQFRFQSVDLFSSPVSLDRTGTLIAHAGDLYNADLTPYGSAGPNGAFSRLSPAGNRLYAITFRPSQVRVWDTSTPAVPELAPIPVPFDASAMGISLNGEHLFIVDIGNLFIVQP